MKGLELGILGLVIVGCVVFAILVVNKGGG